MDSDSDSSSTSNVPSPVRKWDRFRSTPISSGGGSGDVKTWVEVGEKTILLAAYFVTFIVVLVSAIVSKLSAIFMFSQLTTKHRKKQPLCNEVKGGGQFIPDPTGAVEFEVDFSCCKDQQSVEKIAWIWCIFFAYATPQVYVFLKSVFHCWSSNRAIQMLSFSHFSFVLAIEVLHVMGVALLSFLVIPELDSIEGVTLSTTFSIIPSFLLLLSRFIMVDESKHHVKKYHLLLDVPALLIQVSACIFWSPMRSHVNPFRKRATLSTLYAYPWLAPLTLVLVSCGWWETYAEERSSFWFIRWISLARKDMRDRSRHATYMIIAVIKIVVFLIGMTIIPWWNNAIETPWQPFVDFSKSFGNHNFVATEILDNIKDGSSDFSAGLMAQNIAFVPVQDYMFPVWILLIQMGSSWLTYSAAQFACKVQIQSFSFALPMIFVIPISILLLFSICGVVTGDACAFNNYLPFWPRHLFISCGSRNWLDYIYLDDGWTWIVWFLSNLWITIHLWYSRAPRLATEEQIFSSLGYEALFIDQSLMMNRRKDEEAEMTLEELDHDIDEKESYADKYVVSPPLEENSRKGSFKSSVKNTDNVTKIYACATMWHETKGEMLEMLKSIFRIDMDYSARRLAQKYFGIVNQDYYEWETHIFFDDAMALGDIFEEDKIVNSFVKLLIDTIDIAGSEAHGRNIRIKSCTKYPTPYGGRLVWTLPGKTKIVCHLKDNDKIRNRKRWSQCMYMYYLLGFKIMELPISDDRKEAIASNTYILALDGDIDFQPNSIIRLVDLMKKNQSLGAACGRIHPTGSSIMWAYQMFEYAVGHWLQKSTEHVLGCVLCSPGCFSLFRAKALMDDNVMRKYTKLATAPQHYVQYDQGEDRWLCTLLLQRGWRVEYSAASDAFTACPETFDEFYNQRRRWMPSTFANILDLLSDYKQTVAINPDISMLYIIYQVVILIGSLLGPGTIFLAIYAAIDMIFDLSMGASLLANGIPIVLFMFTCLFFDSKTQLLFAKILTTGYCLVMMAVLIGFALQMAEEGVTSPNNIFLFLVFGSFFLAGVLHPQEFWCLPFIIVYYLTVPSMYLLLVIYSLCNLWNVSWGTREVAKKKTKAELQAERKAAASTTWIAREAKNVKAKPGGIWETLVGKGGDGKKATLEIPKLFTCMFGSNPDPMEPRTQLIKISESLEEVSKQLATIEINRLLSGVLKKGSVSSLAGVLRRGSNSSQNNRRRSLQSQDSEESCSIIAESIQSKSDTRTLDGEGIELKIQRVDLQNPFWIEDEDLRDGPVEDLPSAEINFWKDMIEKYLLPIPKDVEKEKKDGEALKQLRTFVVFSISTLNILFILFISMLQAQKELIYIPWPLNPAINVTYISELNQIQVEEIPTTLEPIGAAFIFIFGLIMIMQLIGMLLHRWQTVSHIIATTKIPWCERKVEEATEDGEVDQLAVDFVKNVQIKVEKPAEMGAHVGRRMTVHDLSNYHQETKGQESQEINLEKDFRKRFQNMDLLGIPSQENPFLRKMSNRRGTLQAIERRRTSYFTMERNRSIASRTMSFDTDSAYIEEDGSFGMTLNVPMDMERNSPYFQSPRIGRNSVQFDRSKSAPIDEDRGFGMTLNVPMDTERNSPYFQSPRIGRNSVQFNRSKSAETMDSLV